MIAHPINLPQTGCISLRAGAKPSLLEFCGSASKGAKCGAGAGRRSGFVGSLHIAAKINKNQMSSFLNIKFDEAASS